jgi:hypothetical protein
MDSLPNDRESLCEKGDERLGNDFVRSLESMPLESGLR